jgi:hypothetical protein
MNPFVRAYRRLDLVQGTWWFRITASVLVLLTASAVFGPLLIASYSIHGQRQTLREALENQNVNRFDEHAVSLRDSGAVTVGGRVYRTREFGAHPQFLFDPEGNIAVPAAVVEDLLRDEIPEWAPRWLLEQPGTTWLLALVLTLWLLLIVWIEIALPFAMTALGTAVPAGLLLLLGREQWALAVTGMGLLTFTYVLLTQAALLLYQRPNQILAVAHTVIKEASRSRISLVFIVLLLVILPLLPLFMDPDSPLRFRVQAFISRSVGLTFAIAAVMTLFLSCATVAFEIRDRQIWHLVTKPLNRFNYLIGKWLGVVTVNFILLMVAGVSTFTFIQYLRMQPVAPGIDGQLDRMQLDSEVLAARVAAKPNYEELTSEQLRLRVEAFVEQHPELSAQEVTLALRRQLADEIRQVHAAAQRSIPPGEVRHYLFSGLEEAGRRSSLLTLRYRFYILRSDPHDTFPAVFVFNDDMATRRDRTYVPTMSHVLTIRPELIREDGTLLVSIVNVHRSPQPGVGAIHFDETDLELLYDVASFEGNFFRAILVAWIKLAFLAILGIACSTFLSFSVACLLAFTIFMAGTLGPFLASALEEHEPLPRSWVDWSNYGMVLQWALHWAVHGVAQFLVLTLHTFGEFKPTANLVEGKLIPWPHVLRGFAVLGVVWSGVAMFIGWMVLRARQLAIYSGQG